MQRTRPRVRPGFPQHARHAISRRGRKWAPCASWRAGPTPGGPGPASLRNTDTHRVLICRARFCAALRKPKVEAMLAPTESKAPTPPHGGFRECFLPTFVAALGDWSHSSDSLHAAGYDHPALEAARPPLRGQSDRHADYGEGVCVCVPRAFGPSGAPNWQGDVLPEPGKVTSAQSVNCPRAGGHGSVGDVVGEGRRTRRAVPRAGGGACAGLCHGHALHLMCSGALTILLKA